MSTATWHPVGAVDPRELGEARRQAHNAVQWLARVSHSYLAGSPDNGPLRLGYETGEQVVATPVFAGEISLVLGLADLVMQFREAGRRVSHRIELDGRSPAQVEAWLLVELLHRGVDRDRFSKALPYETADPLAGDGVWYDRDAHAPQLAEFAAWFANGASVLTSIASEPAQSGTKADGIAFHPEPFTLEMHVPLATGDAAAPLARIGLSAGDERRNEPYFYVTGTGTAKSAAVPIGRVITASEVLAAGQSRDWLTAKLREAVGECRARSLN